MVSLIGLVVVGVLVWGSVVGATVTDFHDRVVWQAVPVVQAGPLVTVNFDVYAPDVELCPPRQLVCTVDVGPVQLASRRLLPGPLGVFEANLLVLPAFAILDAPTPALAVSTIDVGDLTLTIHAPTPALSWTMNGDTGPYVVRVQEADGTSTDVTCKDNGSVFPEQSPAFCGVVSDVGIVSVQVGSPFGMDVGGLLDDLAVLATPPLPAISLERQAAYTRMVMFRRLVAPTVRHLLLATRTVGVALRQLAKAVPAERPAAEAHVAWAKAQQVEAQIRVDLAQGQAAAARETWEALVAEAGE